MSTRHKKAALHPDASGASGALEVSQSLAAENRLLAITLQHPGRQADFQAVIEVDLFNDQRNKLIASAAQVVPAGQIDEASVFAAIPEHEFKAAAGLHLAMLGTLPVDVADFDDLLACLQNLKAKRGSDGAFQRLAKMSMVAYDRCRNAEAKRLGIRPPTLDAEVKARRVMAPNNPAAGLQLPNVEPWPEPVDGALVLGEVAKVFAQHVALPAGAVDAIALWVAHAHTYESSLHTPRLNFYSPEKGCGKTTALDVVASLTPRPLRTESMTAPVLFRLVESCKPTLLLDEVDAYLGDAEELRGLLNAGHKRGAMAYRCEGDDHAVRGFAAFAPAVLAGIGTLPGTLHDRSIVIRLTRARPGEVLQRFDSRRTSAEATLCRKLARWAQDNFSRLEDSDPQLPASAFNRMADNWRPLFAVAEVAGGDWPQRAADAYATLSKEDDQDGHGIGATLLADIAALFAADGVDRMASVVLAGKLAAIEGRPWHEYGKNEKQITANQVAKLLRRFKVSPHTLRIGNETVKGYSMADFKESFERFLPPTLHLNGNTVTKPESIGDSALSERSQAESVLLPENAQEPNKDTGCDRVTAENPEPVGDVL